MFHSTEGSSANSFKPQAYNRYAYVRFRRFEMCLYTIYSIILLVASISNRIYFMIILAITSTSATITFVNTCMCLSLLFKPLIQPLAPERPPFLYFPDQSVTDFMISVVVVVYGAAGGTRRKILPRQSEPCGLGPFIS